MHLWEILRKRVELIWPSVKLDVTAQIAVELCQQGNGSDFDTPDENGEDVTVEEPTARCCLKRAVKFGPHATLLIAGIHGDVTSTFCSARKAYPLTARECMITRQAARQYRGHQYKTQFSDHVLSPYPMRILV
jgi:hypothetical protein